MAMREAADKILYARAMTVAAFKRFETPIMYVLRFFLGMYVFSSINSWFAAAGMHAAKVEGLTSVLLASVITAIVPPTWAFMLMWLFIALHLFYFSLELAILGGLLLLCLIFFYIRVFPKESWLIVLLLICFKLKIPYFAPLFAGLFMGIGSVGALIIGCMIWYIAPEFGSFAVEGSTIGDINVLALPQTFGDTLKAVIELLSTNSAWVRVSLVFVVTALAVYFVSRLSVPYSMEASVGVGFFALIFGALIARVPVNAVGFVFSAFFSSLLALICKFFYIIVDYGETERVTFMDDDYLYYVKAVPKVRP